MGDTNSYYAYHTNILSYTKAVPEAEAEQEEEQEETQMIHTKKHNGNDIINRYSASASLSLGSVNERSYQGNPTTTTTAGDDNNYALRISSCSKPLKFPLASEWLV